jgi:hypothetical protein
MSEGFSSTSLGGILFAPGMISELANKSSGWRTSNRRTSRFAANNVRSASAVMLCRSISRRSVPRFTQNRINRPTTEAQITVRIRATSRSSSSVSNSRFFRDVKGFSRRFHRELPIGFRGVRSPFQGGSRRSNSLCSYSDSLCGEHDERAWARPKRHNIMWLLNLREESNG